MKKNETRRKDFPFASKLVRLTTEPKPAVRIPSNAIALPSSSLLPSRNGYPQSFACKPKDWDCANFGADNARKVKMSNTVEEAIAYTGSSIITLNCIVAGLASQLKANHGTEGIEAAHAFATAVARAYPNAANVGPDMKAIADFFNGHK